VTIKRTWVVENKWRCDSCTTENLGRFMACQKCGSPKEKHEKDVVPSPDAAPAVTDPELLRLANQGANWVCEYCGGQVRNEYGKCVKNCGAPREEFKVSSESVPSESRPVSRPPQTGVPPPGWSKERAGLIKPFKVPWTLMGVGTGLAAFIALVVWILTPWEVTTKVSGISWQYTSKLRQKTLMHGEDWGAPSGSFNVSCERKYYGDEDCHPHDCRPHSVSYECNCSSSPCNCSTKCSDNGNGFSTCSESCSTCRSCSTCSRTEYDTCYDSCPVYKDWCSYDYYEWPVIQTLNTAGATHDERWPVLEAVGADQRLDRVEVYDVSFVDVKDPKETWSYKPTGLTEFQKFDTNQTWRLKVNRLRIVAPLQRIPQ
jgi:hypothetical protein